MRDFDFLEPTTVEEACRMLADLGEECRAMAGGTALMLAMRQRMLSPTHIVSLARLDALRGIDFDPDQGLRIGALSRHCDVAHSTVVQQHYPMLASMAGRLANPQVRNQGTLGGNLCYADPATDPPGCLMALDARVVLDGAQGERVLSMQEFLVDYYQTAMQSDELLREIRIAPPLPGSTGHYARFLRTAAEHRPLVNVALALRREAGCGHAVRLVVAASTAIPTRAIRAEQFLEGRVVTPAVAAEAAAMVAADIDPLSDQRGTADYRRAMVGVTVQRSIAALFGLAQE